MAETNIYLQSKILKCANTGVYFIMYQFISNDNVYGFASDYICITARCHSPDLFYNMVIFFDRQEHSGVHILKPYQKMQSKLYGPGMLSLSPHGLWLITIAKCGILYIRDIHTLVNFFFPSIHGICILISYKEQKLLGKELELLSKSSHNLFTTDGVIEFNVSCIYVPRFESLREEMQATRLRSAKEGTWGSR